MAIDYEKTAFNGGNANFVDSQKNGIENKNSSQLTDVDLESLANSFITQDIALQARIFRVDDFWGAKITGRKTTVGSCYSGIVFPYYLPSDYNAPRQFRLRRDKPDYEQKADGTIKERGKYLSPVGMRNMVYFPPGVSNKWLQDVLLPVVITEGEKKTLALHRLSWYGCGDGASKPRFLPIGLSGVWNWRGNVGKTVSADGSRISVKGVIADFDLIKWNGRRVFIVFDQNAKTNESVKKARHELAKELRKRGAIVLIVELPELEAINGVDDLLGLWEKQHGTGEAVERCLELFYKATVFDEEEKLNQATRILRFADNLELFHTADREAFASIETNGYLENHHLGTKEFRCWLSHHFYKKEGMMPSTQALQDAIRTLEGKALFEGEDREVFVRLASKEGKIYLDLCNDSWQIIEINESGWRVIESQNAPVRFKRTKAMMPLPMPTAGGDISRIRRFLNVNDTNYALILAWLVNCFRPDYPFPVLILSGEQGSAKSTTSRLLRELVDPNKTAFRSAPREERDLVIAANNSWVCAFDNLSSVQNWLSDAFCRISTGGGFAIRTLYENEEETIFAAKRPILINGIGDLANRSDLLDRALLVHLETIPENSRKTEKAFWSDFEKEKSIVFSGLLSAVNLALRNVANVKLDRLPRMADFAEWSVAAESGLKLPGGSFMKAYTQNRENVNETALEGLPLADTIKSFCEKTSEFEGTVKEFLAELNKIASDEIKKEKEYPKTPKGLRSKLERINPNLRALGIDIKFLGKSDKGRLLKLEYNRKQPSEPSEGQQNGSFESDESAVNRQALAATVSQSSANGHFSNSNNQNSFEVRADSSDGSDDSLHNHSETEKFCDNCGTTVESYSRKCQNCGELPLGI